MEPYNTGPSVSAFRRSENVFEVHPSCSKYGYFTPFMSEVKFTYKKLDIFKSTIQGHFSHL